MSFFLILLSLVIPKPNYCTCVRLGPIDNKQYNSYNLIAKGKVTKMIEKDFERTIYFTVENYYKGGTNLAEIKITTPKEEGECGIITKKGESWLMFTYANGPDYRTTLCTRTKNMNPQAWDYQKSELLDDIKYLESKLSSNSR